MMLRKWVVTIGLFIILLSAWQLRWEHGPSQTTAGLKIEHLKDRWTGQQWIKLYGKLDNSSAGVELAESMVHNTSLNLKKENRFYSGELAPYFDDSMIDKKYKEIYEKEGRTKKNELENKVNQVVKTQEQYADFQNQYEEIYKKAKDEYWEKIERHNRSSPFGRAWFELELPENEEFQEYFSMHVPKDVLEAHNKWEELRKLESDLKKEIKQIPAQVREKGKSTLSADAIKNRKIATNIWIALFITNIIMTIFFVYKSQQKKKVQ